MNPPDLILKEQEFQKDLATIVTPSEILTTEQYESYIGTARLAKGKMSEVDEAYDSIIKTAHEAHKGAIEKKKRYWQPWKNLFDAVERRLSEYRDKKERERLAEESRLQAIATEDQKKRLLEGAAALEKSGDSQGAAEVLEEALTAPAPVVVKQSEVPQVQGSYSRNLPWEFEIIKPDLVRKEFWKPDEEAIKAIVKAKGPNAEFIIGKGSLRIWRGTRTVIKK